LASRGNKGIPRLSNKIVRNLTIEHNKICKNDRQICNNIIKLNLDKIVYQVHKAHPGLSK